MIGQLHPALGYVATSTLVAVHFLVSLGMAEQQDLSDFFSPSLVEFIQLEVEETASIGSVNIEDLLEQFEESEAPVATESATPLSSAESYTPPAAKPGPPTFAEATTADLKRFQNKNRNKNTAKTTNTWVKRFEAWRVLRNVPLPLE